MCQLQNEIIAGYISKVKISLIFQLDCTATENKELFAAIPFSYGTLGFLTCIDIDIIPYKPYIQLTYHNAKSLDEVVEKFTEVTNDPDVDSVEGKENIYQVVQ